MSIAINQNAPAPQVLKKTIVGQIVGEYGKSMLQSTDPEYRNLLAYLQDLSEGKNRSRMIGKFLVFRNADGRREAIFVVPKAYGSDKAAPKRLISPYGIPKEAKVMICRACGAEMLRIALENSELGILAIQTLGRVGNDSALGTLVEVLD